MKTTLEVPDSVFRRAKARAAQSGQSLGTFVTAALEARLRSEQSGPKPWMAYAGIFKRDRSESRKIRQRIEEACEQIDPKLWK